MGSCPAWLCFLGAFPGTRARPGGSAPCLDCSSAFFPDPPWEEQEGPDLPPPDREAAPSRPAPPPVSPSRSPGSCWVFIGAGLREPGSPRRARESSTSQTLGGAWTRRPSTWGGGQGGGGYGTMVLNLQQGFVSLDAGATPRSGPSKHQGGSTKFLST